MPCCFNVMTKREPLGSYELSVNYFMWLRFPIPCRPPTSESPEGRNNVAHRRSGGKTSGISRNPVGVTQRSHPPESSLFTGPAQLAEKCGLRYSQNASTFTR